MQLTTPNKINHQDKTRNDDVQSTFNSSNCSSNTSTDLQYSGFDPSIYYKRTERRESSNETIHFEECPLANTSDGGNNTLDNMFRKCPKTQKEGLNVNNLSALGSNLFTEQQLGFSMGEFRSGEMLDEELVNDLKMLQTTFRDAVDKSWCKLNDQQTSKIDITIEKDEKNTIKVDEYFYKKSSMPDYLIKNDENKSLLSLGQQFSSPAIDRTVTNNESINNTDFTLSGTTLVQNGVFIHF